MGTRFLLNEDIKNVIDKSTIHGLPNCFRAENFGIRLFWLIAFFVSFAYCSHILVLSIIHYFEYKVTYDIQIMNNNFDMEFPSVTFCNLVPLDYSRSEVKDIIKSLLDQNESDNNHDSFGVSDLRKKIEKELHDKNQFYSNTFSVNKMLLSCTFNGKICNSSYFEFIPSPTFGNCFKFDANLVNESMQVFRTGFEYGLKLELFIGSEDDNPYWLRETGALIAIQNKITKPLLVEEGLKVKPNTETCLKVNRETFKKLSKPYSDCIEKNESPDSFDSFYYKDTFYNSSLYRQKLCMNRCANFKKRESNATRTYKENYLSCLESCPLECTSTKFLITPNHANYPVDNYAKLLKSTKNVLKNMSIEQIKKSVLSLTVFYESLSFSMIEEKPALTFETLLANIGG